jgi:hypothetical protein
MVYSISQFLWCSTSRMVYFLLKTTDSLGAAFVVKSSQLGGTGSGHPMLARFLFRVPLRSLIYNLTRFSAILNSSDYQDFPVWLCAAAVSPESRSIYSLILGCWLFFFFKHERALKLWRTGNAPTKDTKKSFIRNSWAIRTAAHLKVVSTGKLSKRVWV